MTKEQQRIAIAEACGWLKYTQFTTYPKSWGRNPAKYHTPIRGLTLVTDMTQDECTKYGWRGDGHISIDNLPDYLNNLNAMHEAEKALNELSWMHYLRNLAEIVRKPKQCEIQISQYVHATAAQRAEAFLRAIGKWTANPNEV